MSGLRSFRSILRHARMLKTTSVDTSPVYASPRWLESFKYESVSKRQYFDMVSKLANVEGLIEIFATHSKQWEKLCSVALGRPKVSELPSIVLSLGLDIVDDFSTWASSTSYICEPCSNQLPRCIELLQTPGALAPDAEVLLDLFSVIGAGRSLQTAMSCGPRGWGGESLGGALAALFRARFVNSIAGSIAVEPAWIGVRDTAGEAHGRSDDMPRAFFARRFDYVRLCHLLSGGCNSNSTDPSTLTQCAVRFSRTLGLLLGYGGVFHSLAPTNVSISGELLEPEYNIECRGTTTYPHWVPIFSEANDTGGCQGAHPEDGGISSTATSGNTKRLPRSLDDQRREILHYFIPDNREHDNLLFEEYLSGFVYGVLGRRGYYQISQRVSEHLAVQVRALLQHERNGKADSSSHFVMRKIRTDTRKRFRMEDPRPDFTKKVSALIRDILSADGASYSELLKVYNERAVTRSVAWDANSAARHRQDGFIASHNAYVFHILDYCCCNPFPVTRALSAVRQGGGIVVQQHGDSTLNALYQGEVSGIVARTLEHGKLIRRVLHASSSCDGTIELPLIGQPFILEGVGLYVDHREAMFDFVTPILVVEDDLP